MPVPTSAPQLAQISNIAVSNTITETSLLTGVIKGSATFPANLLLAGNVIFVRAWGVLSTKATAPVGTLTIKLKLPSGTTALTLAATTLDTSLTNAPWVFSAMITLFADGTGGNYNVNGEWRLYQTGATSFFGLTDDHQGLNINTTLNDKIDLTATWQTADIANSITINQCSVELLSGLT